VPRYKFDMIESRDFSVIYFVEAEDENEAYDKAFRGDTVEEIGAGEEGVTDRNVYMFLGVVDET
jgi:hypothetical protein